jgi:hypothetical protein
MKIYTDRSIEYREDEPSKGFVLCWERHPTINEDAFACREATEISRVLMLWGRGIQYENRPIRMRNTSPTGSGPGGRIRFGDDKMPTIQRIFVLAEKLSEAILAIEEHKKAVKQWLHHGAQMPEVCKH